MSFLETAEREVVEVGLRADGAKADVGVASARMAIGSFMVGTGDLIGGGDGAWKIYEPPSPEATSSSVSRGDYTWIFWEKSKDPKLRESLINGFFSCFPFFDVPMSSQRQQVSNIFTTTQNAT